MELFREIANLVEGVVCVCVCVCVCDWFYFGSVAVSMS